MGRPESLARGSDVGGEVVADKIGRARRGCRLRPQPFGFAGLCRQSLGMLPAQRSRSRQALTQRLGLRFARNRDERQVVQASAPRRERVERIREFPALLVDVGAQGARAGGRIVASRRLKTRLHHLDRRAPGVGPRRLLERLGQPGLRLFQRRPRGLEPRFDPRAPGDQILERADGPDRKQQSLRLGFALAAEPAQDVLDRVALRSELALPHGDVRSAVVAAPELAPGVDAAGDLERRRIPADSLQFILQRLDRAFGALPLRRELDRFGLKPRNLIAPAFRRRRQAFERLKTAFRLAQRREMRQGAEQALDLVLAPTPLA